MTPSFTATKFIPPSETERAAWVGQLIEASTPDEVAAIIVDLAETLPGCTDAMLLGIAPDGSYFRTTAGAPLTDSQIAQADAAVQAPDGLQLSANGRQLALRLLPQERVVLMLTLAPEVPAQIMLSKVAPRLQLATRHLYHAMNLADLHDSHKQLERSENLQSALFAISDLAGAELDMSELLKGIHVIVSKLMYAENFFIVKRDPERDTMRFLYYADVEDKEEPDTARDFPLDDLRGTLTWHLLTGHHTLMGSNEQLREQVAGPLIVSGPPSVDWLGVPMARDGQVYGALVVQSYRQGIGFSQEDRALLEFVGSHILTALERKQNKDELEQRVRLRTQELGEANRDLKQKIRLQAALFHLAQLATADIDQAEFYQRAHTVVGELLNAENFFIALLSDDHQVLEFPYYVDSVVPHIAQRRLGRGLSEYVLRHKRSLMGGQCEIAVLRREGEVAADSFGPPSVCWLGAPLLVGEEVIGLVAVQSYTEAVLYDAADQELLGFAALQIANSIYRRRSTAALYQSNVQLEQRVEERTQELRQQITQREEVQQQLKHQVMHDPLTGLPNRGFLRDRLDRVLALIQRDPSRRCALLYLDVDRFKTINDSLGHLAGDTFLRAIADRLVSCVREPDTVARLSGDEFAILLEDIDIPAAATNVAQRVLKAVGMPLHIAGKDLEPSISMGIAFGDMKYHSADDLLRDADLALYRAKEGGRKRFELFDEALTRNVVDVLTMEGELRQGLHHNQFEPYFQPICRLQNGRVVGYEALIRWNHPRRGLLNPADFIKIAEDVGLIEAIDWRMFELCCDRFVRHDRGDTFMTINVSALHLSHDDFDVRLLQLLQRTSFPASRLIVELTESALLDSPERVRAILERLRAGGVGAALDDFGTGYSSLSYLHSLPLRMLKIDRSFVRELDNDSNVNNTTVVAAILALASALNIQVVAEGIETEVERVALLAMGSEMGQGYLLGRPAPIEG